ncbi:MAG TPA: aspartyl protease family protein [Pyrinomonadaceae bacterium]|nr:aspartyl protease family protein [Pyrinomonadaceae bacterium]
MQSNIQQRLFRMAAFSVAAFLLCFVLAGASHPAAGFVDKKAYAKGYRALRRGDFDQAEKIFRELLNKDAHDVDARLGLSFTQLKQRNLQAAYDNAARVIMQDPLSARAHALLGAAILGAGEFSLSVEEFRTALSLNGDEALAVAGLAMVDFYENRMPSAIAGLRKAVNMDSEEPDFVFNLGQAAARSEKYKEAADAYEKFLMIAPKTDIDRRERIRGLIDFLRYLGNQGQLYVPGGEYRSTVTFEATDNRPILLVRVNGNRQPLRFVLDTGSGMSVISDETARKLGLKPVARGGMARAVGGGGKFEIVYGFVDSIEIGSARIEHVPVYIRKFFDNQIPVDGYLGLSVISKFLASVDYGTRHMSLLRQHQTDQVESWTTVRRPENMQGLIPVTPNDGSIEVPLRTTSSGFLSGEVGLDGFDKNVNFIIDTAASITVVSEKLSQQEQLLDLLQPSKMRVFGAAGVTEDVKLLQLPRLSLGLSKLEKINAAVLDMEPVNETAGFTQSGILGGNFLRHFRIYFDFARGAMRLEPLNQKPKSNENINPEAVVTP